MIDTDRPQAEAACEGERDERGEAGADQPDDLVVTSAELFAIGRWVSFLLIAGQLGGRIEARNLDHGGAEVRLVLPIAPGQSRENRDG